MKKTALFILAGLTGINVLSSCGGSGYQTHKNHLLNNVTGVDTEGFQFLKKAYEKAHQEAELAKFVLKQPVSARVKELAGRIASVYDSMLPSLASLAAQTDVVLPDKGMPAFEVPARLGGKDSVAFNEKAYLEETLHEQQLITDQFNNADRNTHPALNKYAKTELPKLEELNKEILKEL